tara:strand:+ start:291 stop:488 length:198 start_codon:yes stop_codon:yes gene_type:complete
MSKWKQTTSPDPDRFKGTQVEGLLEKLQAVVSHLEEQMAKDLHSIKRAEQEIQRMNAQERERRDG